MKHLINQVLKKKRVRLILLGVLGFMSFTSAQSKMSLDLEFEGQIWYSYVIDSTYLNVNLPNGELPRREDGTYLYWAYPLTPVVKYKKFPESEPAVPLNNKKYTVMGLQLYPKTITQGDIKTDPILNGVLK